MADNQAPNAATWQALRAWVDLKEALERKTGDPAITPAQVKVIRDLITITEQPEVDPHKNYVGRLNEFAQQNHRDFPLPDFSKEEHTQLAVAAGGGGQWRVFCTLPWCGEVFPQFGYGLEADLQAPAFNVKKVAKQFAAKCALEYIHDQLNDYSTINSRTSTFPSFSSGPFSVKNKGNEEQSWTQPLKKHKVLDEVNTTNAPEATSPSLDSSVKATGSLRSSEDRDKSSDIQSMVRQLAMEMRYRIPTYKITPEPQRQGFYKGVVVWQREPLRPEEEITVTGVYGEAQATEQLAAKVYEWLSKEMEGRKADVAAVMGGTACPPI